MPNNFDVASVGGLGDMGVQISFSAARCIFKQMAEELDALLVVLATWTAYTDVNIVQDPEEAFSNVPVYSGKYEERSTSIIFFSKRSFLLRNRMIGTFRRLFMVTTCQQGSVMQEDVSVMDWLLHTVLKSSSESTRRLVAPSSSRTRS